ncbi:hypothetical protein [Lentzea californiensis]|uniref:hypothetical protein n=1 Tax=Lentzea californiensis TaxID=438851 RepID=UPI002165B82C|nr:hypothetical protein [Lentzea californiensis]MCR3752186.1 hypothetical protein [Lentzea californiensis]
MDRKMAWLVGLALLALVVLGFLIPSTRAGEFTINGTALSSVIVAAIIAGTVLSVGTRRR